MHLYSILEKLGFRVALSDVSGHETFEFYHVNNPDGTTRWLWPITLKEPLFLKFYHTGSFRAKAFATAVKIIFYLRIQSRFFKKMTLPGSQSSRCFIPANSKWALFTGTPGPNRKAIVVSNEENHISFVKVGLTDQSEALIQNEVSTLEFLARGNFKRFVFPMLKGISSDVIELAELPGKEGINTFTRMHDIALREIKDKTMHRLPIATLQCWKETTKKLKGLMSSGDPRISSSLLRKIQNIIENIDGTQLIDTTLAHGDFTPWNTRVGATRVSVFDWELSQREMPAGFDAIHFIIQSAILLERLPWKKIDRRLSRLFEKNAVLGSYPSKCQQLYLELYLVINTVYYLDLYSRQSKWHEQVSWLLTTWTDALNSLVSERTSHRSLVAADLVQALSGHKYAILKDKGDRPEDIGLYSDIDVVISRNSYDSIIKYLSNHSLVLRRVVTRRSNMSAEKYFLQDGSILCVDFIWKIKRKGLEFIEPESIISNSVLNQHGIRIATPVDDARFVGYFYALNNASVPEQYRNLSATLRSSGTPIDDLLANHIEGGNETGSINTLVKARGENRGLKGLRNKFDYVLDSIRMATQTRGMVVTFSGVDGAGKSTIIDQLKHRLEKQLRKRVVVLRHRPSILPILSAWTKGKKQAEQDAAGRLPRLGQNKSKVSSGIRFLYYFIDYTVGQFYVLIRYVWRDYIVLYDRYYFDFITDSRRSNIDVSPAVARLGYHFILKPAYNFFLYASPEMILSRKRELDADTIESLTSNYLDLFKKLSDRSTARYIPIENNEANRTLGTIFEYISKAS